MKIEYHAWDSSHLGQKMELKVYGTGGRPFLVFPSSSGRFFDFENQGMVHCVESFLADEKIQIFSVDGIDPQSWDKNWAPIPERMQRHEEYDHYIINEVVPFVRQQNESNLGIITSGVSMGATHAVNFYFRHPEVLGGCLALSGQYHTRGFFGDYMDERVYYNSPLSYLPNLSDKKILDLYRKGDIIVCVGQGAWEDPMVKDTLELKQILKEKEIPAWIDIWGHDVEHHWHWWKIQFPYFIDALINNRTLKE